MTIIIKTVTRIIVGFLMAYGIYIVLHGHLTPGGGFAGGVIVAGSFVLFLLSYGEREGYNKMRKTIVSFFEGFGGVVFLTVAVLGIIGGVFFNNFIEKGEPIKLFSAGIIPVCNIAIGIKVACALFAIFVTFLLLEE
ncbi:MAG: MnhB domain-containing protein [bacterium]|nr:MnhB domain-containing protein [bacterium]